MPPDPITYQRAARMRRSLTPPEAALWLMLKGKKLHGFKFRRQHPIGPYILDFYCPAAHLAVEVDGASHNEVRFQHDQRRTEWLNAHGVHVLRFAAVSVRDEPDGVIAAIHLELKRLTPPESSLSRSDGEGDREAVEGLSETGSDGESPVR